MIGSRIVTSAQHAALANGMLGHADETDDSHAPSLSHPGCAVVPAALAMAEREGANGTAFLRAVALGYDVGCRLSLALHPYDFRTVGHSTHSFGPMFGAAAAAGALAGVNADQARWLLSYTAQQCSGHLVLDARRGAHREGVRLRRHAGAQRRRRRRDGRRRLHRRWRTCSRASAISSSPTTRRAASAKRPSRSAWCEELGTTLRDHEHQHQALVGGLADPGAARLACST